MAKSMPWIPANMTPDRLRRLEAFSRYRRIGRAEAAGLLIDAGIEALRPTVSHELKEKRAAIRQSLLGGDQYAEMKAEAKRRCAEYRASLPENVSTEASWEDFMPDGWAGQL